MTLRKVGLISALLLCFGLVAGGASAGLKAKTEIKLTNTVDVAGKVKSKDALCKDGRKVSIFKKRSGDDKKLGSDNADGAGEFSFGNPGLSKGKYYVKARSTPGCFAGVSKIFQVSDPG